MANSVATALLMPPRVRLSIIGVLVVHPHVALAHPCLLLDAIRGLLHKQA